MVYCGKPSKACGECRLRRTRCDERRPSCTQCLRAGRTCKGYRDANDLMFRDESQSLTAKHQCSKEAQARKETRIARVNGPLPFEANLALVAPPTEPEVQFNAFSPLSISLGTSPEDQATCFFFQNYVVGRQQVLPKGNFDYLADLFGTEEIGSGLADSIAAIGLSGLANFWKAPNIMSHAAVKYNCAMRTISSQLQDPQEYKSDQTFISILMMGLYETNTCSDRQSMDAWTKHLTGATALLQLRGKHLLETPLGYHMFIHLRAQVLSDCVRRHAPIPQIILDWSEDLDFETPEQATATSLMLLSSKYCTLRSSMSSFHEYSDSERIITAACAIDQELDIWSKTCPLPFIYQTVTLKERSEYVFSDHYHVYASLWIATVWNHYRAIRLLVTELILDHLSHLYLNNQESSLLWIDPGFFENRILASNTTLLQLCHDICASVPYYMGFDPHVDKRMPRPIPKAVLGNLLLWPLYSAGVTDLVSDMMRDWVAGQLRWISDVIGIRQAGPLASSLIRKQDILMWRDESEEADLDNLTPGTTTRV